MTKDFKILDYVVIVLVTMALFGHYLFLNDYPERLNELTILSITFLHLSLLGYANRFINKVKFKR